MPSPKLPAGAAPPQTIAGLAGPMAPSSDPRRIEPVKNTVQTAIYTYFTQPTGLTNLFYSTNEREWVRITLNLETAGPVAVGTSQDIAPLGSGKGRNLPTGEDVEIILPPSHRLYILAETVDRVATTISPYPWLYQILATLERLVGMQSGIVGGIASSLARMLKGGR
jgi:hypothetical protein